MFSLIIAGVVLFVFMRHRITKLHWGRYLLWVLGATVALFMTWLLEYAFIPDFSNTNDHLAGFIFWSIFLLYGLVLAATSLW